MADRSLVVNNGRKEYLDVLRTCAIFAVVLMHGCGFYVNRVSPNQLWWHVSLFLEIVCGFAVPVFVMISGALILNKDSIDIKELYKKNIVRFVTAYLFWSFVYVVVYSFIPYYGAVSATAIKDVIAGTLKGGYFHLWFMPLIIGLYIAAPIVHKCVRAVDKKHAVYWLVGSMLFCFVIPQLRHIQIVEDLFGESLNTLTDSGWSAFVTYFVLGYVLDRIKLSDNTYKVICLLGVLGLVFSLIVVWVSSVQTNSFENKLAIGNSPNVMLTCVALFVFVKKRVANNKCEVRRKVCSKIAQLSFGIYFVHELILVELHNRVFKQTTSLVAMLSVFALGMASSIIVVWGIRKLRPLSKYIT